MISIILFFISCYAFIALLALLAEYAGGIAGTIAGIFNLLPVTASNAATPGDAGARRLERVRNLDRTLGIKPRH